jgi:hypothetical protein
MAHVLALDDLAVGIAVAPDDEREDRALVDHALVQELEAPFV